MPPLTAPIRSSVADQAALLLRDETVALADVLGSTALARVTSAKGLLDEVVASVPTGLEPALRPQRTSRALMGARLADWRLTDALTPPTGALDSAYSGGELAQVLRDGSPASAATLTLARMRMEPWVSATLQDTGGQVAALRSDAAAASRLLGGWTSARAMAMPALPAADGTQFAPIAHLDRAFAYLSMDASGEAGIGAAIRALEELRGARDGLGAVLPAARGERAERLDVLGRVVDVVRGELRDALGNADVSVAVPRARDDIRHALAAALVDASVERAGAGAATVQRAVGGAR